MKHCWHKEVGYRRCCFCGETTGRISLKVEEKAVVGHGEFYRESVPHWDIETLPDDAECPSRLNEGSASGHPL